MFRAAAKRAARATALFFLPLISLIAGVSGVATAAAASVPDAERPPALLLSPASVKPGDALRVLAAFETAFKDVRITVSGPEGTLAESGVKRGGGPPFWRAAQFRVGRVGRYSIVVRKDGRAAVSAEIDVPAAGGGKAPAPRGLWRSEKSWSRAWENLYS
ncbi:MAG: hypothetical protein ABFD80_00855, partial [Acidobacteriota bacterium]